jgi:hypothetical protein
MKPPEVRVRREHNPEIFPALGQSMEYLTGNRSELQAAYGGKWVALHGREVRVSADDLASLHRMADDICPDVVLLIDYIALPGEDLDWK